MDSRTSFDRTRRAGKARLGFTIHLAAYLAVNALLVFINLNTSSARLWFYWPLLGWGVGLLAHAFAVFALPRMRDARARTTPRGVGERVSKG
jgi:hypothetical protein